MSHASPSVAAVLARYYDLDLAHDPGDLDMYLALAGSVDGAVLELLAGSGRLAVPLAATGSNVVAVDRDPAMLGRAGARWEAESKAGAGRLELVEADVLGLDLERRFGLVIVGLNGLLLVEHTSQAALFETVGRHLQPGGRAVIDTWLPTPEDLALYDGRLVVEWIRNDPETGETVAKLTSARYSSATREAEVTTFFDTWREDQPDAALHRVARRDRIWFSDATRIVELAERAGLVVDTLAGDYEMGQFGADSERLVLLCRSGTD